MSGRILPCPWCGASGEMGGTKGNEDGTCTSCGTEFVNGRVLQEKPEYDETSPPEDYGE